MTRAAALSTITCAFTAMLMTSTGCQDRSASMIGLGEMTGTAVGPSGPGRSAGTGPALELIQATIQEVYWSADGKWLVSVASDSTVTVWDPAEERKAPPGQIGRHTFGEPRGWGGRAAVTGDVLVDDTDQRFTVRQISTGRTLRVLDQSEHVYGDQFRLSDDGKRLVALNDPRQEFNVWDMATGKLVHSKLPTTDWRVAHLLGLSADAAEAYVVLSRHHEGGLPGDPPRGVHAVNLQTGAVDLRVDYGWLPAWQADKAVITQDRQCFIDDQSWDLKTGKETGKYPWRMVWVVSADGRFAVAEEMGAKVTIWDVGGKKRLGVLPRPAMHTGPGAMAFSPDGALLALGGSRAWKGGWTQTIGPSNTITYFEDRALMLYDVQTQKRVRTLAFPLHPPDSEEVPRDDFP